MSRISLRDLVSQVKINMEELTPQWEAVFERTDGVDIESIYQE